MSDDPFRLAYEVGLRSLSQQEGSLDSLHTRAGTLVGAISISTSFLGALALADGRFSCWSIAALITFGFSLGSCILVLWPQKWEFRIDPGELTAQMAAQPNIKMAGWHAGLAEEIGKSLDVNDQRLNFRYFYTQLASVFLLAEIVFWILDLSGR
jgi:hypothetical protein